ncbi:PqiB family protein [Pseudomonas viridiflava]|uniref:PqiB family protein n=1 Tax=Pseudomonas viridiflava TaxID=33069 RepID=UPI000C089973|nr:MlaD family protein [Pseudomonas viridiflava]PHN62333.1 mammalian cell entry protein [Pseudomonas viridiflava]
MSDRFSSDNPPELGFPNVKASKLNVSLIWLVPIIAALIGLLMLVNSIRSSGPEIFIDFQTAEGLEANKTAVKYKNVVIGQVTAIALSEDHTHVVATVALNAEARSFSADDSIFWVVRPRIGAHGISGVDTILSGAFIGADGGKSKHTKKHFQGLETPPPITYGEKGKRFTLHAEDLGSIDIGSPIYYRRIQAGQVVAYHLSEDGKGVDADIFIQAPYDKFVTTDTRFWNASGIDLNVGADGLKIKTQSLSTVLAGGIAFIEPKYSKEATSALENARFNLFNDQETAMAPPDGEPGYIRMTFKQSLRGLEVNSPVEFMGVNIGRVVSVDLDYDARTKSFSSIVGAVMYPNRLGLANEKIVQALGDADDFRTAQLIGEFVKEGLRAQARTANLLTGQLYISLDFIPKAAPVLFDLKAHPLMIPTVPGSFEKVQEQVQTIVEKISKLPMEKIAYNLNDSLSELRKVLKQVNSTVLPQLSGTLVQTQKTLDVAASSLAEDSPARQQIGQMFDEIQRAARSMRFLTDYLSRNPEALIRGRIKQSQPEPYKTTKDSILGAQQ